MSHLDVRQCLIWTGLSECIDDNCMISDRLFVSELLDVACAQNPVYLMNY